MDAGRSTMLLACAALVACAARSEISDLPASVDASIPDVVIVPDVSAPPDATPDASVPPCCDEGTKVAGCRMCSAGETCQAKSGTCVHDVGDCGPSTCDGCCYDSTTCADGLEVVSCGTHGALCQSCSSSGKFTSCSALAGGGGVCTGGPSCNAMNCGEGCCDGDICTVGNTVASCGRSGEACAACATGQSCVPDTPTSGTCQFPPFCDGQSCSTCCAGNQCEPGTTDTACGAAFAGGFCVDCTASGMICQDHLCVVPCSSKTCGGCCAGTTCVTGNHVDDCGLGGAACANCTKTNEQCVDGACQ
jgi:hypothetical protein